MPLVDDRPRRSLGGLAVEFSLRRFVRVREVDRASARQGFLCSLRPKGAGRNEAGLDICEIKRVELRPQHVGLESQRRQCRLLLLGRARVFPDVGQGEGQSRGAWSRRFRK